MNIRIPRFLVKAWDAFGEWANVSVYKPGPGLPIDVRRLDILLAIFFIIAVSYYSYTDGWIGALIGGAFFILVAMWALWMV